MRHGGYIREVFDSGEHGVIDATMALVGRFQKLGMQLRPSSVVHAHSKILIGLVDTRQRISSQNSLWNIVVPEIQELRAHSGPQYDQIICCFRHSWGTMDSQQVPCCYIANYLAHHLDGEGPPD